MATPQWYRPQNTPADPFAGSFYDQTHGGAQSGGGYTPIEQPPRFAPAADPFAALAGGPTVPQGTPIPGAEGLNMLVPGASEQFFKETAGQYQTPSMSEGYAKDAMAKYGGGGPGVSNNAQGAFDSFKSSTPADMSPYYDNAKRRAQETIDRSLAARGAYGGSAANDAIAEAFTNLDADRASKEAGYGLDRARTMGGLATGADSSSLAGSADARGWMSGLGGVVGNADQASLSRLTSGQAAAGAAQGAQTVRGQNMFNNNLNMGNALSNTMGSGYDDIFKNDKDLFNSYLSGMVGGGAEAQGQATQGAAQSRADEHDTLDALGNFLKVYKGSKDQAKVT